MSEDETLVVQSGQAGQAVLRTGERAPLVLMANGNLVGRFATPERFYELERAGLITWGGLTAGAWQYIGAQGVIQGTYETFAAVAREHFAGDLAGRLVVSAGLGGMGAAQPLAVAAMLGGVLLCAEADAGQAGAAPARRVRRTGDGRHGGGARLGAGGGRRRADRCRSAWRRTRSSCSRGSCGRGHARTS